MSGGLVAYRPYSGRGVIVAECPTEKGGVPRVKVMNISLAPCPALAIFYIKMITATFPSYICRCLCIRIYRGGDH